MASGENNRDSSSAKISVYSSVKRLPTLRLPRDLTLGASKSSKRTFTPNVTSKRTRVKEEPGPADNDKKTDTKPRAERGRERGRGRGRGKREYVQMEGGIFSDGYSDGVRTARNKVHTERATSYTPKPKLEANVNSLSKEEEEEYLNKLMRDDFIDDGYDFTFEDKPTTLPMQMRKLKKEKLETNCKIVVKKEPMSDDDLTPGEKLINFALKDIKKEPEEQMQIKREKDDVKHMELITEDITVDNLLNSTDEDMLFLMMFPDVLPVSNLSDNPVSIKIEPGTSTAKQKLNTNTNEEKKEVAENIWSEFSEGRVGKLRIHKSGRVTIRVGEIDFNVEMGTETAFLQDVVSVNMNSEPKCMNVLGHIDHRLKCVPDVDNLLKLLSLSNDRGH